jgi:GNAT superfamily N-acetyltransferase
VNVTVSRVDPEVTLPLRQRVLRPHQSLEEMRLAADDDPATGAYAAFDDDGTVIGTAIVLPQECPWRPGEPSWRLRGMATADGLRGLGVGARVLDAVIAHVAAAAGPDGAILWCNARTPAVPFYQRAGFQPHGEVWEQPPIGPHIGMWRRVTPAG